MNTTDEAIEYDYRLCTNRFKAMKEEDQKVSVMGALADLQ